MNIDDIKNIWKEDMNQLEARVQFNENKIKQLELNKSQSSFNKFLNISLAGKNMALIYAIASLFLMYKLWGSAFYVGIVSIGAAAMIFSYIQHSPLKKLNIESLSIIALQKEVSKFRIHTAKTAVYDLSIVGIWMATVGVGFYAWTSGGNHTLNLAKGIWISVAILTWFIVAYFGSKFIYKDIDEKLKESENILANLSKYETS
ncbi:hypothetical protein ACFO5T_02705 [Dokdonia genika]|jgi:hypothetical protein|uniref:2TM domain-containing protein n=1 Tax=Dokdonia genika TaxID=308113 RepID=A0ABV9L7G5_9FLAO|nr:hypothetical protein [Dokdonia donghaensis]